MSGFSASSTSADIEAVVCDGFRHWLEACTLDPELQDCTDLDEQLNRFAESNSVDGEQDLRFLFGAAVLLEICNEKPNDARAAQWFVRACTGSPELMQSEVGEVVSAALDCTSDTAFLSDIIGQVDAAERIENALRTRRQRIAEFALICKSNGTAINAPCKLEQIAYHCYKLVVGDGPKQFKEEYLVQKAIYWTIACWAYWKKAALVDDAPVKQTNGPYFEGLRGYLKQCRDGIAPEQPKIADPDVERVLRTAADHVRRLTWQTACDETHGEPLWILTPLKGHMDEVVRVYSSGDVTGKLNEIFPWLTQREPASTAARGASMTLPDLGRAGAKRSREHAAE